MTQHLIIPAHQAFITTLARHILQQSARHLPDLSRVQVFLPNALSARQLQHALGEQHQQTLIKPDIASMSQWIQRHIPLPDLPVQPLNPAGRQLLLFEALKQHRNLFRDINLWQICNTLLQFFDELNHSAVDLQQYSAEQWQSQLQQAYGIPDNNKRDLEHLFYEARIVYTLWQAWQQQTRAMQLLDQDSAGLLRLQQNPVDIIRGMTFFVIAADQLSPVEQQWCQHAEVLAEVIYVDVQLQPDENEHSRFIHQALDINSPLHSHLNSSNDKRLFTSLKTFAASSAEQQAQAIHMQTRLWLTENRKHIAIVSENRKLMRRVRALMERSGITVEDTAGWSLATTSAASCVERWLQIIEQDFAWQPLLDFLKSPFFCADSQRDEHLKQVYRLEQDIIIYERITADIHRYRHSLQQRRARLHHWHNTTYPALMQLLDRLEQAAAQLRKLCTTGKSVNAVEHLDALLNSLESLGVLTQLEQDDAGKIVLDEIRKMRLATQHIECTLRWPDFRTWLGTTLEQQVFTPGNKPARVYLLNLKQAEYCEFDAVILAAANADSLPGKPTQTPFFNQAVRQALHLKTWTTEKQAIRQRFIHLLHSAPDIRASYQTEQDGEWLQVSPWLQSLLDHARLKYATDLHDTHLFACICQEQSIQKPTDNEITAQPSPSIAEELYPAQWSVSGYQRLMDCPYKFFGMDVLALKTEDQISRELLRSEYGEKIHATLRAFFEQQPHLPAPFTQRITAENREQAIDHLLQLARKIFSRDMEDNVQHQGWLQQWQDTAGHFVDWLIERQATWRFSQAEIQGECEIDTQTRLHGRLDLIETNGHERAIIDYKTGTTPTRQDILSGENVQLTAYALLMEQVNQVGFLKLDRKEVKFSAEVEADELQDLAALNRIRLQELAHALRQQQGLTARGDQRTCNYCNLAGVCRRQIWQPTTDS